MRLSTVYLLLLSGSALIPAFAAPLPANDNRRARYQLDQYQYPGDNQYPDNTPNNSNSGTGLTGGQVAGITVGAAGLGVVAGAGGVLGVGAYQKKKAEKEKKATDMANEPKPDGEESTEGAPGNQEPAKGEQYKKLQKSGEAPLAEEESSGARKVFNRFLNLFKKVHPEA